MKRIERCGSDDFPALVGLWERSVRATHDFLDENAIGEIREALIPDYFPNVELYAIWDDGSIVGFAGLRGDMIEMLFVDGDRRGHGYGSSLIEFAISRGAAKVDVNEQNPMALAFYLTRGFKIIDRDDTDDAGRPYPILHLSL